MRTITRIAPRSARLLAVFGTLFSGKPALFAQPSDPVKFRVSVTVILPTPADTALPVSLAGSFNGWNPAGFPLQRKGDNMYSGEYWLPAGAHQFKCTRGSWATVEQDASGDEISNRKITVSNDTSFTLHVPRFRSAMEPVIRTSTASPNVRVWDTAFFMPTLNRYRTIRVYLPPNYSTSKQRYPVMYMLDGQNLFDDQTAAFGEWGVDECLDSFYARRLPVGIVVGIDNGPKRLQEYNRYDHDRYGPGEGEAFIEFMINTLKPAIDKAFRTLPDPANTGIAGSSMGGLLAYTAALEQPQVFGMAGVLSPSFWIAPELLAQTKAKGAKAKGKYFFYRGGDEDDRSEASMDAVFDAFAEASSGMIYRVTDPGGTHSEATWRTWLGDFFAFIWADGFNRVVGKNDPN